MLTTNHKITGKIVITASFKTISPFAIGKGKSLSEETDGDVMTDDCGKPYIPASSFAGKLKAFIKANLDQTHNGLSEYFWGSASSNTEIIKQEFQSHLNLENAMTFAAFSESKIKIRDGVKINYETGMALPGAKYDYQVVEPDLLFYLKGEINIRRNSEVEDIIKSVRQIHAALKHPGFRIGALTNHGFGKIQVENFNTWHFDFSKIGHNNLWFDYLTKLHRKESIDQEYFEIYPEGVEPFQLNYHGVLNDQAFIITSDFKLKSTMIIGTYGTNENDADKKHLQSNGQNVITGKSIRGALRNRAERIAKTLNKNTDIVNTLFGEVNEDDKSKTKKGKLRIEEVILSGSSSFEQSRTRIDRFTGGVRTGALFNSEPVQTKEIIRLQFTVSRNASPGEKGLLLLLLKDLWTEDLAIGGEKNVGRGMLKGLTATIKDNGAETAISQYGITEENINRFNEYTRSLSTN